jgi:hypothetical protein
LLAWFVLEKFRLAHHKPTELPCCEADLLCSLVAFLLVDVEVALESVQKGDRASKVHPELQLFYYGLLNHH